MKWFVWIKKWGCMIKAILDACVLYRAQLRNFLIHLADNDQFCPLWSEEIQNEWTRNLLQKRPDLKQEKIQRTCQNMNTHLPKSLVQGYESRIQAVQLPDPDDRHVIDVAIHANAEYIVTFDLRGFPKDILHSHKIEAISPDDLTLQLIQKAPRLVLDATKNHRSSLIQPPFSEDDYIIMLENNKLPKTAEILREHKNDI